jgi:radical SAM superfamily enzyme YgiQ (UPF0313 family)
MAKIFMVQIQVAPYVGTAYLSAAAKQAGHEFIVHLVSNRQTMLREIDAAKPNLIGFSCMTPLMGETLSLASQIKKHFDLPIILGGPHPTLFPEVIQEAAVDIVCRGEAEETLAELLTAIDEGRPYTQIRNLWVKQGGEVHQNPLRPFTDPLDGIPLIDWSCYGGTPALNSPPIAFPIRGCPFSCSYCFNAPLRQIYQGLGRYVRHFSAARAVQEVQEAIKFFTPSPVLFASDSLGIDLPWTEQFLDTYSRSIALPFVFLIEPQLATDRFIDLIARYNCKCVALGVESGSERVRKQILNRRYTNQELVTVAERFHRRNIKIRTYNMIGLPTETEAELWETIEVNWKMKTDYPRGAIFVPLPGTGIVDLAKREGYLDEDFSFRSIPTTILATSVLKKLDRDRIANCLCFFQTAIIFPKWTRFIKFLIRRRPNALYRLWFGVVYAYLHRMSEDRKWIPYIKYVLSNAKYTRGYVNPESESVSQGTRRR